MGDYASEIGQLLQANPVDQSNPRMFRGFSIVVYAAQGELPDTTWVCDQELEQARAREQEYWQFMQ